MVNRSGWNHQWVWPIDKPRGHSKSGFFGRLRDVMTKSGPDMFVQPKGSRNPIKADRWGNWDSYHHPEAADKEYAYEGKGSGLLRGQSRGTKRYDPYTRKYVEWTIGENHETNPNSYPTITMSEAHQLSMKIQPKNWNGYGPKRFRPQYDHFWQTAHRAGENMKDDRHPSSKPLNPYFSMASDWQDHYQNTHGMPYYEGYYPYGGQ